MRVPAQERYDFGAVTLRGGRKPLRSGRRLLGSLCFQELRWVWVPSAPGTSILGRGRRVGHLRLTVDSRRPRAFPCTRRSRTVRCARGRPWSTELSPRLGRRVIFFLRVGGRCLGEPAPATCLVSSPAACAAAASKFLCLPPESAVWIDPPRAVAPGLPGSRSPGARVRGAARAAWSRRAPGRSCGRGLPG